MLDARDQNYSETLSQISELQDLIGRLEKNISVQLPQGISNEFISTKEVFMNWAEEAEFVLKQDYKI